MKIKKLQLSDFRGFDELELNLEGKALFYMELMVWEKVLFYQQLIYCMHLY